MSDSDLESESDIPPNKVYEQRCQEFGAATGTDSALVMSHLRSRK